MSVAITGKRIDGTEFSKKYTVSSLVWLKLDDNQLKTIDLRPLKKWTGLEKLYLDNNQFKTVNLRL